MSTDFNVESTLSKLTMGDKIKLLAGDGWWHTHTVESQKVPAMRMSDGPNGIRGTRFFNGVPSSCFPSSTGLGSSFDVDLAHQVGEALAEEARAKGCHIILAPTVNTQRSPLGGRGFESFSEDPTLNGEIAAAYINGVQSKGISATIKHFVANDQEFQRFSINSQVSERALREIYLKPFQIAIKKSNPWALMTAYNRLNGIHCSENERLLKDILRKEWEYEGLVMSDWIGVFSTSESIKAGLDLEMPGPTVMRGKAVERALIGEKLFPKDIDDRVRKILELLKRAYASGVPFDAPEEGLDTPEVRALLRKAAADAIVLLKNDTKLLPLSNPKRIAVIGPNAKYAMTSGGGSAALLSTYTVSPLEALTKAATDIGAEVEYTIGAHTHKYLPVLDPYIKTNTGKAGALLEFWNEAPSATFLDLDVDLKHEKLASSVWSTHTNETKCFLADGVDESKVNELCWLRFTTNFIPDESGDWDIGLNIAGNGNLFIDDKLVIDLSTDPAPGESFFGLGTVDARAIVRGLEAGKSYKVDVRLNNAVFVGRGSPFRCWGGIRLGGIKRVDPGEALEEAVSVAKRADVAILVIGLNNDWESEGFDRQDMKLPGLTNELVTKVLVANPNTVVVNQSGTPVEMPWVDSAPTLLQAFYGGNEVGSGLADVIFGAVTPSAKLALTFPKRLEDNPTYPSFGDKGEEYGNIVYNEGIFVGYRSYDKRDLAPLFPFGYGLSYTTFSYTDLSIKPLSPQHTTTVAFTVHNTGNRDGREVAQVYITPHEKTTLPRPPKELKGFKKVFVKAGESVRVEVELDRDAWAYYDPRSGEGAGAWVVEEGVFGVVVGGSSVVEGALVGSVEVKKGVRFVGL